MKPLSKTAQLRIERAERVARRKIHNAQVDLEMRCYSFQKYELRRYLATGQGHIYLIQAGPAAKSKAARPYKIGYSKHPEKRLIDLQGAHHEVLSFRYISPRLIDVQEAEDYLHQHFSRYNIRGEWFSLTPRHINRIIELTKLDDQLGLVVREYRDRWDHMTETEGPHNYQALMSLIQQYYKLKNKAQLQYRF